MSGQDEIIEGLAPHIMERGEVNIKGQARPQDFQMSHPLSRYNNDISELVNDGEGQHKDQPTNDVRKWADELARADERAQLFQAQLEETKGIKRDLEERLEVLER